MADMALIGPRQLVASAWSSLSSLSSLLLLMVERCKTIDRLIDRCFPPVRLATT